MTEPPDAKPPDAKPQDAKPQDSTYQNSQPWYVDVALPVLLGSAREVSRRAIRAALTEAGFSDIPRSGSRLIGGIARFGPSLGDLATNLGISKQATSQLVDTLVLRNYVERVSHPTDRRRLVVDLTERGRLAAEVIRGAVDQTDALLAAAVGDDTVLVMRRALGALVAAGNTLS